MNNLLSRTHELQRLAHELMYLGMDGSPVYSDDFCRLNKEVLVRCDSLFPEKGSDIMATRRRRSRLSWIVSAISWPPLPLPC